MSGKRILWVDNLKGVLILLVVLGHTIQFSFPDFDHSHVFNYIYAFHMPLFFAISGFVSYKAEVSSLLGGVRKRGVQLLIPYILWTMVFCYVSDVELLKGYFQSPVYWFLILLFIISTLMTVCQWISNKVNIRSEIVVLIVAIALFAIYILFQPDTFALNILHIHFFFYALGWYLRKYEANILQHWLLIPTGLLFAIFGWFYQRNASPAWMSFVPASFYFLLSGTIGTIFFLLLFRRYVDKELKALARIGQVTLGIYVIHLVICGAFERMMTTWVDYCGPFVGIASLFALISTITMIISFYLKGHKLIRVVIGLKN